MIPESWKRKDPPVFRFSARIRWLAGFLGFYSLAMTMLLVSYASEWTTMALLVPVGAAGQLLAILAWTEEKVDDRTTNGC